MSFFSALKRAFGFNDDGSDHDDIDVFDASHSTSYVNPFKKASEPDEEPDADSVADESVTVATAQSLPTEVMDDIVNIINGSLSPLLLSCVDVEAEKKAVYDALGPRFHDYVENIGGVAVQNARSQWNVERTQLQQRLSKAQEAEAESARKATEAHEKQQSAELQLRASKARLADMENKVANLEAEREQYDLENRSLANKIKVIQTRDGDADSLSQEIARLNGLLAESRRQAQKDAARIAELESAASKAADDSDAPAAVESADVEALRAEFKEKLAISNTLMNDLRATVVEKTKALEEAQAKVEALQAQVDEGSDDALAMEEVAHKLEEVEDFKKRKNEEIRSLKEQLEQSAASHDVEMEQLRAQLKLMESDKLELGKQLTEKESDAKKLAEKRTARDVELANRIDSLKSQIASAATRIEEYRMKLETMSKSNDEAIGEVVRVTEERDALSAQVEQFRQQQTDLQQAHSANEAMQKAVEQANAERDAARLDAEALSQSKVEMQATIESLEAERKQILEKMEALNAEMTALKQTRAEEQVVSVVEESAPYIDETTPIINESVAAAQVAEETEEQVDAAVPEIEIDNDLTEAVETVFGEPVVPDAVADSGTDVAPETIIETSADVDIEVPDTVVAEESDAVVSETPVGTPADTPDAAAYEAGAEDEAEEIAENNADEPVVADVNADEINEALATADEMLPLDDDIEWIMSDDEISALAADSSVAADQDSADAENGAEAVVPNIEVESEPIVLDDDFRLEPVVPGADDDQKNVNENIDTSLWVEEASAVAGKRKKGQKAADSTPDAQLSLF